MDFWSSNRNFTKRLIKSPKLYFLDTGLAAWLLGIRNSEHVASHPLRGNLFETLILSEILNVRYNRAETEDIYFWRDSQKNEIDFVIDQGFNTLAVEAKSSHTIHRSHFKGLNLWRELSRENSTRTLLVVGASPALSHQKEHHIATWDRFTRHLRE